MPEKYAAILGLNPSKGARSPKLWNNAFSKLNQKTKMICIDIEDEKKVCDVIRNLQEDKYFIGGCIAFPYKETIFKILGIEMIDMISQPIGAINCIYRSEDNILRGTNTDGAAALASFLKLIKENNYFPKSILIAGLGGAGKAVASYFASYFIPKGTKIICVTRKDNSDYCASINVEWLSWQNIEKEISKFDSFVNCTTFGTGELINKSPIEIYSRNNLKCIYYKQLKHSN